MVVIPVVTCHLFNVCCLRLLNIQLCIYTCKQEATMTLLMYLESVVYNYMNTVNYTLTLYTVSG